MNISTAVAFVAAELGLRVVKHGNRAVSSRSGSSDVLEELGLPLDIPPAAARRCLDETGLCFLFAPLYHPVLSRAMPVRRRLRTRTLLNLVGPLINPARPEYQLVGVYDPALCRPVAEALRRLGCTRALVVHGSGLDELALHGRSSGVLLDRGSLASLELSPEDVGLPRSPLSALRGGTPGENAARLAQLLAGSGEPAYRDVVAWNAGALYWVCEGGPDLHDAVGEASEVLRSGRALARLEASREACRGLA